MIFCFFIWTAERLWNDWHFLFESIICSYENRRKHTETLTTLTLQPNICWYNSNEHTRIEYAYHLIQQRRRCYGIALNDYTAIKDTDMRAINDSVNFIFACVSVRLTSAHHFQCNSFPTRAFVLLSSTVSGTANERDTNRERKRERERQSEIKWRKWNVVNS